MLRRALIFGLVPAWLASCAQVPGPEPGFVAVPPVAYRDAGRRAEEPGRDRRPDASAESRSLPPLPISDRMARTLPPGSIAEPGRLYSFRTRGISVTEALAIFARANNLNVIAEPGLEGTLSVDFENVPLERAFDLMLSSLGYAWELEDKVIRVRKHQTRTFRLDYVRLPRPGGVPGPAGLGMRGAAASAQGGEGSADDAASSSHDGRFWSDLEAQLRGMLSKEGRMSVNRLTGTVQVTDLVPRLREIEAFVDTVRAGMRRQIDIEVRIAEVTLRDDQALGLDWSRLPLNRFGGYLSTDAAIDGGGGPSPVPSSISGLYRREGYEAILGALSQQGEVRVVSQPRIRVINNQTAFVKVGTDETFWTSTVNRLIQPGGGVVDSIKETPNTVTLGVLMTVTPQISADGYAMLDISPTVTRLAGTVTSPRGDSNAPSVEVKQTNTLVRVRDGEMVLLGGLIQEEGRGAARAGPAAALRQAGRRKELVIFLMPSILPDNY